MPISRKWRTHISKNFFFHKKKHTILSYELKTCKNELLLYMDKNDYSKKKSFALKQHSHKSDFFFPNTVRTFILERKFISDLYRLNVISTSENLFIRTIKKKKKKEGKKFYKKKNKNYRKLRICTKI